MGQSRRGVLSAKDARGWLELEQIERDFWKTTLNADASVLKNL